MSNKINIYATYRVWNDTNDCGIEIAPDRDGLGLIEVRNVDTDGTKHPGVVIAPDEIPFVIEALKKMVTA